MATSGDNPCLPLNIIINILKRLLVKSLIVFFSPSGKQVATESDNPYLPQEIIINILKRLPVKLLLQFQFVCKDWRNLLKSPYFIAQHHDHSALNSPLLICYARTLDPRHSCLCLVRYKIETVEVERIPTMDCLRRITRIIGSSNGLLCVNLGYVNDDPPPSLLLLNPATREVRHVPRSKNGYCPFLITGFGYSHAVRDYKIVTINVNRLEVFSLRMGFWKALEFAVLRNLKLYHSEPVTVNGAIFWLGVLEGKDMTVSFDLAKEVFTFIPLPSSTIVRPFYRIMFDVYENKVAMVDEYDSHGSSFIDLWVLEEGSSAYGKSWGWTKKYSIRPTFRFLHPKFFWRNEIVCYTIDLNFWFNLTTDNELKKFHTPFFATDMLGTFSYVESLVSLCDTYVQ